MVMRDMVFADNRLGALSLNIAGKFSNKKIKTERIIIHGESDALDCHDPLDWDTCWCSGKFGFMLSTATEGGKPLMPKSGSALPISGIMTYATFEGEVELDSITFKGFKEETHCGYPQRIFERNPTAADYTLLHKFDNTRFENVSSNSIAWIEKPDPSWATTTPLTTPSNCGNWPCTGPENIVLHFENTSFDDEDLRTQLSGEAFQIISGNEGAVNGFNQCEEAPQWHAYLCQN